MSSSSLLLFKSMTGGRLTLRWWSRFGWVTAAFLSCNCDCRSLMPDDQPDTFSVVRVLTSRSSYKDILPDVNNYLGFERL